MQLLFDHNQKDTVLLKYGEPEHMEPIYENYTVIIPALFEMGSQIILFDIGQMGFSQEEQLRLCDFMVFHTGNSDVHRLVQTVAAMTKEDEYMDEIIAQLKQLLDQTTPALDTTGVTDHDLIEINRLKNYKKLHQEQLKNHK